MIHLIVFLSCLAGFGALAVSQERHKRPRSKRALSPRAVAVLRVAGALLLICALALAISSRGTAMGVVVWCGHLGAAAGGVYLLKIDWADRAGSGLRDRFDGT